MAEGNYSRRVAMGCAACGVERPPRYGIPDPCLGMLPGVHNACCGHGNAFKCYVDEGDDQVLRGEAGRARLIELGGDPAPLTHDTPADIGWVRRSRNRG